jgi:hypothetical protein
MVVGGSERDEGNSEIGITTLHQILKKPPLTAFTL